MEMTLLRMIAFRPAIVIDEDLGPGDFQESGAEVAAPAKKPEREPAASPAALEPERALDSMLDSMLESVPDSVPESAPEPGILEPARWAELLDKLPLTGIIYNVASHCELRQVDGDKAYLVLDEANASLYSDSHSERIAAALGEYLGRPVAVHVEVGVPRYETPAVRAQRLLDERQALALANIEDDPKVQLLLDRFEGTLDRDSVTPIKH